MKGNPQTTKGIVSIFTWTHTNAHAHAYISTHIRVHIRTRIKAERKAEQQQLHVRYSGFPLYTNLEKQSTTLNVGPDSVGTRPGARSLLGRILRNKQQL